MKWLVGSILLFLLALILLPPLVGIQIEKTVQQQVDEFVYPGYQIAVEQDRGYRHSEYRVQVTLDPLYIDAQEPPIVVEPVNLVVQVQHGLFLTQMSPGFGVADFSLQITAGQLPQVAKIFALSGQDLILELRGRLGIRGDGFAEFDIPAFSHGDASNSIQSEFSGMTGIFSFTDGGRDKQILGSAQNGFLRTDAGQISFEDLRIELLSSLFEHSDYLGEAQGLFEIEKLSWSDADKAIVVDKGRITFDMGEGTSADTIDLAYQMSLDSISAPDILVTQLDTALNYRAISRAAMEAYILLYQEVDYSDQVAVQRSMLAYVDEQLPEMLRHNPGLSLNPLSFVLNQQHFDASLDMSIDGSRVAYPVNLANPYTLLTAVRGELDFAIDESLVRQLLESQAAAGVDQVIAANPDQGYDESMRATVISQQANMMLNMTVGQGFALRDRDQIVSHISLQQGVLNVNGAPMPLPF